MGAVLARDVHVTENGVDFVVLPAGSAVPKKFAKLVTNPKAFVDEVEESTDGESAPVDPNSLPYDKRGVKDLRALLKGHELPSDGDKKALVARLIEFDKENADESTEDEDGGSEDSENSEE